jgi:hypothetical protein
MDYNFVDRFFSSRANDYEYYRNQASQEAEFLSVGDLFQKSASAFTPSSRSLKVLGVAFALATGAFVLTMLKDPPTSVASDPAGTATSPSDIQVPTGIPAGNCATSSVCP